MVIRKQLNCPLCHGELIIKHESGSWYEECVLCGQRKDVSELVTINAVGQLKILNRIENEPITEPEEKTLKTSNLPTEKN